MIQGRAKGLVIGLIAASSLVPGSLAAELTVRVRIAEGVRSVSLAGSALEVGDRPVNGRTIRATVQDGRLEVGPIVSRSPLRVSASDGVRVDGRPVSGQISLVPRPDGALDVVSEVALEAYVERSVAGEVYADWPTEALKAQAVVARTYALHERARSSGEDHDLESSVMSQRYVEGVVPPRLHQAAAATRNEFLAYDGAPILAAFHASAGGHTASSEEVWGQALPYLRSVESPDDGAPHYFWSYEIGLAKLQAALREAGYREAGGSSIRVVSRTSSGRVKQLEFGRVRLSGRDLREVLGGAAIRSAMFDVRAEADRVRFLGSGSGHGVGLCQWGSFEMAQRGKGYQEILQHYYPGTALHRLAPPHPGSAAGRPHR